jgi:hypothetical protein
VEEHRPTSGPDGVPALRRTVERTTRLAVGALGSAVDAAGRVISGPGEDDAVDATTDAGPTTGDLIVGATMAAQERMLDTTERAARAVGRVTPLTRWMGELPLVRPGMEAVNRRVDELARRGAVERRESQALVAESVDGVIGSAVSSDLLGRTIDEVVADLLPGILEKALPSVLDQLAEQPELLVPMVDALLGPILDSALPEVLDKLAGQPELLVPMVSALLGPILDTALPEVLDKLNQEPEVVRELVLGQSVSIVGEMTGVVRSRGAVADDLVERIARKVTLRKPRAALPTPPRQLVAGSGDGAPGNGQAPS